MLIELGTRQSVRPTESSALLVERLQSRLRIDRVRILLMIAETLLFYRFALESPAGVDYRARA